jgi:hypothetical protein
MNLIERYFRDVWRIITQPTAFFRTMPTKGGLSYPFAFALVTHWLGSAGSFLWQSTAARVFPFGQNSFDRIFEFLEQDSEIQSFSTSTHWTMIKHGISEWLWGAGSVIADPFTTLATLVFTAAMVYIGAKILVPARPHPGPEQDRPALVTFESAARIVAFGMTPSILSIVPFAGAFMAGLMTIVVTVIGAREVYGVRTGRAIAVALFPKILFIGLILSVFVVIALLFVKVLTLFM